MGNSHRAEEKCEEEGLADRNRCVLTVPTPGILPPVVWVEEFGLKDWNLTRERGGEGVVFTFFFLFPTTQIYFNYQ